MTSQLLPSDEPEAASEARPLRRLSGAERLVGIGFRCWLAGFDRGNFDCWTIGWQYFAAALGPQRARLVAPELANWVRSVHAHAARPIEICPSECRLLSASGGCAEFCHDECMAVAIIAASQHPGCPALHACAAALTGAEAAEEVVEASRKFGRALANAGIVLDKGEVEWAGTGFGGDTVSG